MMIRLSPPGANFLHSAWRRLLRGELLAAHNQLLLQCALRAGRSLAPLFSALTQAPLLGARLVRRVRVGVRVRVRDSGRVSAALHAPG